MIIGKRAFVVLLVFGIAPALAGVIFSTLSSEEGNLGTYPYIELMGEVVSTCNADNESLKASLLEIRTSAKSGKLPKLKTMLTSSHPLLMHANVRDGLVLVVRDERWLFPIQYNEWIFEITNQAVRGYELPKNAKYYSFCISKKD